MKTKTNIKLPLTTEEKASLRQQKIRIADLAGYATYQIEAILQVPTARAKEIYALATFQSIPSIGIKFAEDLVFLGFYSLDEFREKDGAKLFDAYEQKVGYWVDPCVEDQFRLIVYFARTFDTTKTWWDFTDDRKKFRAEHGYPRNRPQKAWFEVFGNE
ncbi:helix-hairpin-helix domain-containing protein [Flavobacterium sp.]|uniref:helix-hairpin-helix domain-containing protein n=1 Tax=Flavobacterium sp. TaxID=239 RepID=UPI00263239B0|nr:helix-hairpin-helix domain-containing protein [Flavobacterium sp.]